MRRRRDGPGDDRRAAQLANRKELHMATTTPSPQTANPGIGPHRSSRTGHRRDPWDRSGDLPQALGGRRAGRGRFLLEPGAGGGAAPRDRDAGGSPARIASGRRWRMGGVPARRWRGDRRARPPRHPRQQRRRHRRQARLEAVRRRLAQGPARELVRGASTWAKPAIEPHDRARVGQDHLHLVGDRRDRQHRPGELRGLEVGRVRTRKDARSRRRRSPSGSPASSRPESE